MASNIQNTGALSGTSSTGGGTTSNIVRVFDIVLNSNHPIFVDEGIKYDPTLIGMIFYGDKDLDVTSTSINGLSRALPLNRQRFPLINEVVKVETGPSPEVYSDIGGKNSFTYTYYNPAIPVHNNVGHNALPSEKTLANNNTTSEDAVLSSNGTPNVQQSTPDITLDNTGNLIIDPNVKPLGRGPGDTIIEGTNGSSIKMTTTFQEGVNNISGDTLGDPALLLRVGQSENQTGATVNEDVNGDHSSIYLLSDQSVNNIRLTVQNFDSLNATYVESVAPTIQFTSASIPQVQATTSEPVNKIVFEETGSGLDVIEETPPPPVTQSAVEPTFEDPIFAALASDIEEGFFNVTETAYKFEENEPDIDFLIDNTPINYIPPNAGDLDFDPSDDPSKSLNPDRIGRGLPTTSPLVQKFQFNGKPLKTYSEVEPFIQNGTLIEVGDSNIEPKRYAPNMTSAKLLKGKYYLHYACAPAFENWMSDLIAAGLDPWVTSCFRFGGNVGGGPHGYGMAVDFNNLYKLVNGSTSPTTNQKVRIEEPIYTKFLQLGIKHGWYNPWRLANGSGTLDEVWHFEYWGSV